VVETKDQIEGMIEEGMPLRDIEGRIDDMPVDEEAKAALWLRAYSAKPGLRRGPAAEEYWRSYRVAGE
jgi:hypothetical protein